MKKLIKAAFLALLVTLPLSYASAAPLSDSVKASIANVVSANPESSEAAVADLIAALKAEIKVQGLDNVKGVAMQVMANAKDEKTAKELAKALSTAALMVAKSFQEDLNLVAADLAAGIEAGTSPDLADAAIDAASTAAVDIGGQSVADTITQSASTGETPQVVTPSGDAGTTPAVDLSADTGVSH
jgi:hypothetical protein